MARVISVGEPNKAQWRNYKGPLIEYNVADNGTLAIHDWEASGSTGTTIFAPGAWTWLSDIETFDAAVAPVGGETQK